MTNNQKIFAGIAVLAVVIFAMRGRQMYNENNSTAKPISPPVPNQDIVAEHLQEVELQPTNATGFGEDFFGTVTHARIETL